MRSLRRLSLLVVLVVLSLGLAFPLRNAVHDLVIVPLAYLWWIARVMYLSIPQFIRWGLLIVCVGYVLLWKLLPEPSPIPRTAGARIRRLGAVEFLAVWILKARTSNYYKWQLAHRLGRTARALQGLWGQQAAGAEPSLSVRHYLDAGTEHSFVDFATPRNRFRRRSATPLDLDPLDAVDYLESQLEMNGGPQARGS